LGEVRQKELLGRTYDLKKGLVVDKMAARILDFRIKSDAQTNMGMNSKYSTWSESFEGGIRKASFGTIEDFKKGECPVPSLMCA